jgi:nucleoid DNA-binding protein
MSKQELVESAAIQAGVDVETAGAVVRAFLDELMDTLVRDGRVELRQFGVFELRVRQPRRGRNPRTGERIHVPIRVYAQFKAGSDMQRLLDQLEPEEEPSDQQAPAKRWWQL